MVLSFVGHAFINSRAEIKELVKVQIRKNIANEEDITCLLGGKGDFDEICAGVCKELKQEYRAIVLVYVTPYITLPEQNKIKEMIKYGIYDESVYPPIEKTPKRFAISKRNEWMIENSDLIIAYVNHTYGGAYKTLQVAKRNKKKVINICDLIK